ncbi:MAG: leucine-rich repeat domain-containing protein, partial [Ruminiclostridium sp.]|nr:leucine-rich repeat domain-containing protein [Ruminiclostridium sp.]
FYNCALRTVKLPAGLEKIGLRTFSHCDKLEMVDFGGGSPFLDLEIFELCPKLSAENVIQGLACSVNAAKPFHKDDLSEWDSAQWDSVLREDVFELALKNNSFAFFNKEKFIRKILKKKRFTLLPLMENYDWKFSKELIYSLVSQLDRQSDVGYRAWLLNYKDRHFGTDEKDVKPSKKRRDRDDLDDNEDEFYDDDM